jgi:hypothetical protein
MVAMSSAVRQKLAEKMPERRPISAIVASAIGIELCLKPSVWVTTSTRAGWPIDDGEAGSAVGGPVSLEHDEIITAAASVQSRRLIMTVESILLRMCTALGESRTWNGKSLTSAR